MLNLTEGNIIVKELIEKNEPFSLTRMGIGEIKIFNNLVNGHVISESEINILNNYGGFYGNCLSEFIKIYLEAIKDSDIHCHFVGCGLDDIQNNLYNNLSPKSIKIHHRIVDPYLINDSWISSLKNKKVLVVNPFSETINNQYKNIDKIWLGEKKLPNFDLQTYKSVQSIGDLKPHSSWVESFEIMKDDISKLDFDVALLGCGTYGLPLSHFIKNNMKKQVIYIGGAVQILFGIKGKRWDVHPEVNVFYNEHWVRPSDNERPHNFATLEGGTYW